MITRPRAGLRAFLLGSAALLCLFLCACRRTAVLRAGPGDAAAEAGAEAPRRADLVAIVRKDARWRELPDGSLVLDMGLFLYEAGLDGLLSAIGGVASYASLVRPDDDDLVGGLDRPPPSTTVYVAGTAQRPIVVSADGSDGVRGARRWSGTGWEQVGLPAGGDPEVAARRPPDVAVPPELGTRCRSPRSRDRSVYQVCDGTERPVLQLVDARWEPLKVSVPPSDLASVAIADDGAVWFWHSANAEIARIRPSGEVERFPLPKPDAALARPSFHDFLSSSMDSAGKSHSWRSVLLAMPSAMDVDSFVEIVPQRGGQAWVLASTTGQAELVLHIGRRAPSKAPLLVGTTVDQQNEVRNSRKPRRWVGHCPQLFVVLAIETQGVFAPARAWSQRESIAVLLGKDLAKNDSRPARAALVEGRLSGTRVAGVLLWRSAPDLTEASLEAAAKRLVERFTDNPAGPPVVVCMAPVLERAEEL